MTRSSAEGAPLVAVLAAGKAARFGGGKLDALCSGKRLAQWALDCVEHAGLAPGLIVTPGDPPAFAADAQGWTIVPNPEAESGLASSLACAALEAEARHVTGLLVLLADMPLVPPEFLRKLAQCAGPAATRYPGDSPHGRPGAPALVPAALFPELMELEGDRGAAAILAAQDDLTLFDAQTDWLIDVDTPDDFARAERLLSAG